jgi:hypothetical protein
MRKSRNVKKYQNKKSRTRKMRKTKKCGGDSSSEPIKNSIELTKNKKYIIKFYNDEDDDEIEDIFAKQFNGVYDLIKFGSLSSRVGNKPVSYNVFKKGSVFLYVFQCDSPYHFNDKDIFFKIYAFYEENGLEPSDLFFHSAEEYYNPYRPKWVYCNIFPTYTNTDLTNISSVSRLSNPYLPLDIERNMKSFLIGK